MLVRRCADSGPANKGLRADRRECARPRWPGPITLREARVRDLQIPAEYLPLLAAWIVRLPPPRSPVSGRWHRACGQLRTACPVIRRPYRVLP
jgi:hypothetical protein